MARRVGIRIRARRDDVAGPRMAALRPKATEADRLKGAVALMCLAVLAGAFVAYQSMKPDPLGGGAAARVLWRASRRRR